MNCRMTVGVGSFVFINTSETFLILGGPTQVIVGYAFSITHAFENNTLKNDILRH